MRAAILILCTLFIVTGCSDDEQETTRVCRISLDDAHNIGSTKDPNTPRYLILPCATLIVDQRKCIFRVPEGLGVARPNAVHLLSKGSDCYRIKWAEGDELVLSRQTLVPINESPPFEQFRLGQTYVLAIGHDNFSEQATAKIEFWPMWVGALKVNQDGASGN